MEATRNADGTITVPKRAEEADGTIGDGFDRIGPSHPAYAAWDEYLNNGRVPASARRRADAA